MMNNPDSPVPDPAETIKVLSLMGNFAPMLMLRGGLACGHVAPTRYSGGGWREGGGGVGGAG